MSGSPRAALPRSKSMTEDYKPLLSELEAKIAVYAHLAQAMDDIKLGRIQDSDDAFDEILSDLENLDV